MRTLPRAPRGFHGAQGTGATRASTPQEQRPRVPGATAPPPRAAGHAPKRSRCAGETPSAGGGEPAVPSPACAPLPSGGRWLSRALPKRRAPLFTRWAPGPSPPARRSPGESRAPPGRRCAPVTCVSARTHRRRQRPKGAGLARDAPASRPGEGRRAHAPHGRARQGCGDASCALVPPRPPHRPPPAWRDGAACRGSTLAARRCLATSGAH